MLKPFKPSGVGAKHIPRLSPLRGPVRWQMIKAGGERHEPRPHLEMHELDQRIPPIKFCAQGCGQDPDLITRVPKAIGHRALSDILGETLQHRLNGRKKVPNQPSLSSKRQLSHPHRAAP